MRVLSMAKKIRSSFFSACGWMIQVCSREHENASWKREDCSFACKAPCADAHPSTRTVGNTDGVYLGKKYFKVNERHGLFVSIHDLLSVVCVARVRAARWICYSVCCRLGVTDSLTRMCTAAAGWRAPATHGRSAFSHLSGRQQLLMNGKEKMRQRQG